MIPLALRLMKLDGIPDRLRFSHYIGSPLQKALPWRQQLIAPIALRLYKRAAQRAEG